MRQPPRQPPRQPARNTARRAAPKATPKATPKGGAKGGAKSGAKGGAKTTPKAGPKAAPRQQGMNAGARAAQHARDAQQAKQRGGGSTRTGGGNRGRSAPTRDARGRPLRGWRSWWATHEMDRRSRTGRPGAAGRVGTGAAAGGWTVSRAAWAFTLLLLAAFTGSIALGAANGGIAALAFLFLLGAIAVATAARAKQYFGSHPARTSPVADFHIDDLKVDDEPSGLDGSELNSLADLERSMYRPESADTGYVPAETTTPRPTGSEPGVGPAEPPPGPAEAPETTARHDPGQTPSPAKSATPMPGGEPVASSTEHETESDPVPAPDSTVAAAPSAEPVRPAESGSATAADREPAAHDRGPASGGERTETTDGSPGTGDEDSGAPDVSAAPEAASVNESVSVPRQATRSTTLDAAADPAADLAAPNPAASNPATADPIAPDPITAHHDASDPDAPDPNAPVDEGEPSDGSAAAAPDDSAGGVVDEVAESLMEPLIYDEVSADNPIADGPGGPVRTDGDSGPDRLPDDAESDSPPNSPPQLNLLAAESAGVDLLSAYAEETALPPEAVRDVAATLIVSDLSVSVMFYTELLGLVEIDRARDAVLLEAGFGRVLLWRREDAPPAGGPAMHLTFEVGDIDSAYRTLSSKGVHFTHPPRSALSGEVHDLRAASFLDPDGHGLAITELRQRST